MSSASSKSFLNIKILPIIVFSIFVAITSKFLWWHVIQSGTSAKLLEQCSASNPTSPYDFPRTGLSLLNRTFCVVVTLFHSVLDSDDYKQFITYFLYSFSYVAIIPSIEAARHGVPSRIAYPLIIGLLNQTLGVAFVMPIYLMFLINTGTASLHSRQFNDYRGKIDQGQAEALFFGFILGYIIPTFCLVGFRHPYATVVWQFAPLLVYLSQRLHLYFRPSSLVPQSGYRTVQATYVTAFILSALAHSTFVWPLLLLEPRTLVRLFLPSLSVLHPHTTTLAEGAVDFLKWDATLAFLGSALAVLWFARNSVESLWIIVWLITCTFTFGPGAAIAGLWMWREKELNGAQVEERTNVVAGVREKRED